MNRHRGEHGMGVMCRLYGVSRAGVLRLEGTGPECAGEGR